MTDTNGQEKTLMYGQEVTEITANEMLLKELLEDRLATNEMTVNAFMSRIKWWQDKVGDPQRNISKECGYPEGFIPIQVYRDLYDHDAISARVVEVMPIESWQVQPSVFEDEDSETETPFEKAWQEVHKNLHSAYNPSKSGKPMQSFYQDETGSLVWSYLLRLDIRSGIGHYGVLLLGIDDGRDLRDPVEGFEDLDSEAFLGTDGMYGYNPFYPYTQGTDKGTQEQIQKALEYKSRVTGYKNRTGVGETPGGQAGYQLVPGVIEPIDGESGQRRLVYLRVFDESLAQITRYERDPNNPRFGLPTMYLCTFNDPKNDPSSAAGLPVASSWVHWSRLIHFADKLGSNEVLAYPRMKQPYNRLLDLCKVYGASGEGFWQMAFAILSAETHPQLGGDVKMDVAGINAQVEKIRSGLKRHLLSAGVAWKSIAPVVSDPTAFKDQFIEAICIYLGCPIRVFKGSERGELASSQDDSSWNDRLRHRQNFLLTPRLIVPFIDRLIHMGVLPEPKGYSIVWPDLESLSDKDKAAIFAQRMTAFSTYVSGGTETIMTPLDMLMREADYTYEEAEAIIDAAQEVHDAEEGGMTPGMPAEEEPEPVSGVKMKEGESLVHPSTGQKLTAADADVEEE